MKNSFVVTFSFLLQIINIVGIRGIGISQEKCEFYQNTFRGGGFSFMVRVNNGDDLNGVLISENFVLTIANNETEKQFVTVEALKKRFDVINEFQNEQRIKLLQLHKSVEFNDQIGPVCLPQSSSISSPTLTEICWAYGHWLHELKLKIISHSSCDRNTFDNNKDLYIQGVENGTSLCGIVEVGNRRDCNKLGATLLSDHQEIVGIASEISYGNPQIFVQVSDHVSWIESIVWPSRNDSTTTEIPTSTAPSENETAIASTTIHISTTRTTTPTSDDKIILSQIGEELHEIHMFLNVNLIVIVLILFLVLFIACILWSDGLCLRAVLPDQSSITTDV